MTRDTNAPLPDTAYWRAYQGRFSGIPTWALFDSFWAELTATGGDWYVFDPEGEAPTAPVAGDAFLAALASAKDVMDPVRDRSYCGTVFADDLAAPTFVKVFDPWKMGGVCGSSGERVMPQWIFSRIAPDPLPAIAEPPARKGLLARLTG